MLEANLAYWDPDRYPHLQRIIFDNTLSQKEAIDRVKDGEGSLDLVTDLSPLETLRVAQSSAAQVVKSRGSLTTVFGFFNRRKSDSPWHDQRLRQAVNYAINREDLIRYATRGNGVIIPALVPTQGFGYALDLVPYPFDPAAAQRLLGESGHTAGITLSLIASEELQAQATVVSKMLEQVGFKVDLQILNGAAFNRKIFLSHLDQPAERQPWDIALTAYIDLLNFPALQLYRQFAIDGPYNWGITDATLQQLHDAVLRTVDRERQQELTRQMERHTHAQAYFLFLYNPIQLYAANKDVDFTPYVTMLNFAETTVTAQHWSVRQQKAEAPGSLQAQSPPPAPRVGPDNAEQVALGQQVYVSFCTGCHGANLEGQANWQKRLPLGNYPAPPHDDTGHTWHHADQWLFEVIKHGGKFHAPPRYRSAMPAYQEMLSDEEIWAVLAFIKSHWSEATRVQQEQQDTGTR